MIAREKKFIFIKKARIVYNIALELEKAALVGLFRNAAYPLVAFAGTFLFKQRISKIQWVSLLLILLSMYLGFA